MAAIPAEFSAHRRRRAAQ